MSDSIQTAWTRKAGGYQPVLVSPDPLPSGRYVPVITSTGDLLLQPDSLVSDRLAEGTTLARMHQQLGEFQAAREDYRRFGLLWCRKFLLHGPPGTGKSSLLVALSRRVIKEGGVVVSAAAGSSVYVRGLSRLRQAEPDRFVLFLMEDVDQVGRYPDGISDLLGFLNGESQIENLVFIGTTNYPEKIDRRFFRPGRFDAAIQISEPDAETKAGYLQQLCPDFFFPERVEEWLHATQSFTFADLKEVYLQVVIFKQTLEEAVQRVKDLKRPPTSGDYSPDLLAAYR